MLHDNTSYITLRVLLLHENTFMGWACWICGLHTGKTCQIPSANAKQLILLLTLVWHCLLGCMNKVWRNKTYWQFSDLFIKFINLLSKGLKNMWKNHTQLQQTVWFVLLMLATHQFGLHTAVGGHLILQSAFVMSQPVWLCCSLWNEQHTQADPRCV